MTTANFEGGVGMSSLAVKHAPHASRIRSSAKVPITKYEGTEIPKPSNIETNPRIGIGQVHMWGDEGMKQPQAQQLPPELLQKIRETLARGIAKSIVAKSINQISQEALEAKTKISS